MSKSNYIGLYILSGVLFVVGILLMFISYSMGEEISGQWLLNQEDGAGDTVKYMSLGQFYQNNFTFIGRTLFVFGLVVSIVTFFVSNLTKDKAEQ
ncbi:hypothetical protein [Kurthia zopfii]|uniref:hypothetical protein n=1 Tax=Kurthia zopfii TaxID=1650 RepID=UPI000F720AAD|nr:hypothetical protein [Kurthia zopfii]VEI08111.1 Uncharacterised protein [Kurthia zopfii]